MTEDSPSFFFFLDDRIDRIAVGLSERYSLQMLTMFGKSRNVLLAGLEIFRRCEAEEAERVASKCRVQVVSVHVPPLSFLFACQQDTEDEQWTIRTS